MHTEQAKVKMQCRFSTLNSFQWGVCVEHWFVRKQDSCVTNLICLRNYARHRDQTRDLHREKVSEAARSQFGNSCWMYWKLMGSYNWVVEIWKAEAQVVDIGNSIGLVLIHLNHKWLYPLILIDCNINKCMFPTLIIHTN